jgi:hypothetical protein
MNVLKVSSIKIRSRYTSSRETMDETIAQLDRMNGGIAWLDDKIDGP